MSITVVIIAFVVAIMLVAIFSLRFIARGRSLLAASTLLVVSDLAAGLYITTFDSWLYQRDEPLRIMVMATIIYLMAQLLMAIFIFIRALAHAVWRRMLAVPYDEDRRSALRRSLYPAAGLAAGLYGGLYERTAQVERHYDIAAPGFAGPGVEGLTVAQLSDIHLGLFFSVDDLRALLEQVRRAQPDILVLTGDVLDDVSQNAAAAQVLDEYAGAFPRGMYYIVGNHEYYRGIDEVKRLLAGTHVRTLYNAGCRVDDLPLYIAGTEYAFTHDKAQFARARAEFTRAALAQVEPDKTILLAHHPEFIDDAAVAGVPLTLTGHTHGGQFGFFGLPLFPGFKYTRGMVNIGDSVGYVHSGNGSWFPFRLGCPPEIAYFTLRGK